MTIQCWAVTWAGGHLLDFDDESLALRAAVALEESGREGVKVTQCDYTLTAADEAAVARVRERVQARIRAGEVG